MIEKCEACRFFDSESPDEGTCRRYAPRKETSSAQILSLAEYFIDAATVGGNVFDGPIMKKLHTANQTNQGFTDHWPLVKPFHWCGEYEGRK